MLRQKTNKEKLIYCRKKTNELNTMIKSKERTILYMLMTYCVYLGNILIHNKFNFKGLEMNIYVNNRYTVSVYIQICFYWTLVFLKV